MTQLGGSINELEIDLLEILSLHSWMKSLPQNKRSLDWSNAAPLNKNEVISDLSISNEASHWSDGLLSEIEIGRGVRGIGALTNPIDLLIHVCSMMVAHLTGSGNGPLDSRGMPRSDTADLSKSSMGLSWQLLASESLDDSAESLTLGGSQDIDGLKALEDLIDGDFLLEERVGEVDLVLDGSSIDLNLIDIGLLDFEVESLWLSVADESDDRAVLDDLVSELLGLLGVGLEALLVLGEGSSLGLEPVLVESSLEGVREGPGKDRGKRPESPESLDIADHSDDSHGGSLDDGDWLDFLLLVEEGAGPGVLSDDVGHAGLDAGEGGQVGSDGLVVLGEGSDSSGVMSGSSLGEESEVALSWFLKLSMGHGL